MVTSDKPFFDPAVGTSQMSTGVVTQASEVIVTGASPVQATRDVAASMTATQPVEAPGTKIRVATQPVQSPGTRIATQPVEVPGARSEVYSQPTRTSSVYVRSVNKSLTSNKTVPVASTVCLTLIMTCIVNRAPLLVLGSSDQGQLSGRDTPKDKKLDLELSWEANYLETMG